MSLLSLRDYRVQIACNSVMAATSYNNARILLGMLFVSYEENRPTENEEYKRRREGRMRERERERENEKMRE